MAWAMVMPRVASRPTVRTVLSLRATPSWTATAKNATGRQARAIPTLSSDGVLGLRTLRSLATAVVPASRARGRGRRPSRSCSPS
jgi:hypothetical protein